MREKRAFSKIITGTATVRPAFSEFKDLPMLESIQLAGRPAAIPNLTIKVKAEKGVFSTTYSVLANFVGTMPLSNKYGGKLTGFADVSDLSVRYFDAEGNSAGVTNRSRFPWEKPRGISVAMGDDYCLGIEGNLAAVTELISSVRLFSLPALQVLKAVATDIGDMAVSRSG
jgi:hypothetical protein